MKYSVFQKYTLFSFEVILSTDQSGSTNFAFLIFTAYSDLVSQRKYFQVFTHHYCKTYGEHMSWQKQQLTVLGERDPAANQQLLMGTGKAFCSGMSVLSCTSMTNCQVNDAKTYGIRILKPVVAVSHCHHSTQCPPPYSYRLSRCLHSGSHCNFSLLPL